MSDSLFSGDDTDYVEARINKIGFLDEMGLEGAIVQNLSMESIFPLLPFQAK